MSTTRRSSTWLRRRHAVALSPPLPLHDAARVARRRSSSRCVLLAAATRPSSTAAEFRWTDGAALRRLASACGSARTSCRPSSCLMLGHRRGAVRIRARAAASRRRRRDAGRRARRSRSCRRACTGPLWIALTALALPLAFATGARALRVGRCASRSASRSCCRLPWPLALYSARPAHLRRMVVDAIARRYLRAARRRATADPLFFLKNLPWFAWPALPLVLWTLCDARRAASTAGSRPRASSVPGVLALVIARDPLAMREPRLVELHAAARAARAARGARRSTRCSAASRARSTGSAS